MSALGRHGAGRATPRVASRSSARSPGFLPGLALTVALAAFLIVPALLSMLAGVTVNYFRGLSSGLTLDWVRQVLELYAGTIWLSLGVALATLVRHPLRSGCRRRGSSCACARAGRDSSRS